MPLKKLKDYLDENNIKYVAISHSSAFTALEVAASAHFSGKELAKTVMVKVDGKMAMAVLPASYQVDLGLMRKAVGAKTVEIASEDEFGDALHHETLARGNHVREVDELVLGQAADPLAVEPVEALGGAPVDRPGIDVAADEVHLLAWGVHARPFGHRRAVEGDDAEAIKRANDALNQASHKLAEAMYRAAGGPPPGAEAAGEPPPESAKGSSINLTRTSGLPSRSGTGVKSDSSSRNWVR